MAKVTPGDAPGSLGAQRAMPPGQPSARAGEATQWRFGVLAFRLSTSRSAHAVAHPPRRLLPVLLAAAALAHVPERVGAQLAHYWGDHFGNESVLLNGAVVGSVTDAGAVFYNPARLLHQESPSFVASAKLYEWTSYRIEDGLGEGRDLEQSRFGGAPGFLVGTFTLPFLEGHQFAYGVMTRHRANVNYAFREESEGEVLPSLPGDDSFVGLVDLRTQLKDDWMGLSWAHALGASVSAGASLFYYERTYSSEARVDLRGINEALDVQVLEEARFYNTREKGLVAKLGLALRAGAWSAGVTTTLPRWALSARGGMEYEDFWVGLVDGEGTPVPNRLVSTVQGGLPVEWKTPWSFGAGIGWKRGAWHLHGALEYFTAVPEHVLLTSSPTRLGQSTGSPIDYTVIEARKSVLNGGVGVKWAASDDLAAFVSVVSNNSAAPDSVSPFVDFASETNHTTQQMDFVLMGGGLSITTRWADLTFGATWQGSSQLVPRLIELPSAEEDTDPATFRTDEWRFLLGFSVPFVDERLGTLGGT